MKSGTIVLGAAALAAIGAIGYKVSADRAPAAAPGASPDTSASASASASGGDAEPSLAAFEKAAADAPGDVAAQRDLGRAYLMMGRYADSANSYARAVKLDDTDAALWAALGEARTLAGNGVTREAHDAFARALALDPKEARSRYFIGVEKDVAGDHKGAVKDWTALLADATPDAPWAPSVRALIEQVAGREKIAVTLPPAPPPHPAAMLPPVDATAAIPGPSPDQLAAARGMTPGQQDQMARGMVDRLAARLAANPRDEGGWIRLMRARMVLGDQPAAADALAKARAAFAGDAATRTRIDAAAQTLGVGR